MPGYVGGQPPKKPDQPVDKKQPPQPDKDSGSQETVTADVQRTYDKDKEKEVSTTESPKKSLIKNSSSQEPMSANVSQKPNDKYKEKTISNQEISQAILKNYGSKETTSADVSQNPDDYNKEKTILNQEIPQTSLKDSGSKETICGNVSQKSNHEDIDISKTDSQKKSLLYCDSQEPISANTSQKPNGKDIEKDVSKTESPKRSVINFVSQETISTNVSQKSNDKEEGNEIPKTESPKKSANYFETKEIESCSKYTSFHEIEMPEKVTKQKKVTISGHSLLSSKSNVMLKAPSLENKQADLQSNTSSIVYSNSEFSIPSALKVGLEQYSFLDKYSYSYLDAYNANIVENQSETRKPRVQIVIKSETELIGETTDVDKPIQNFSSEIEIIKSETEIIKGSNIDFHNHKSCATLLPKNSKTVTQNETTGIQNETENGNTKAISDAKIKPALEVQKPIENNRNGCQTEQNQSACLPSAIMLYSQTSGGGQLPGPQGSQALQSNEVSQIIVPRQRQFELPFAPSDLQPEHLLSPALDVNQPILLDTGQPQLCIRSSPFKFNQIRNAEQPKQEIQQETMQKQEDKDTTGENKDGGSASDPGKTGPDRRSSKQDNQDRSQAPQEGRRDSTDSISGQKPTDRKKSVPKKKKSPEGSSDSDSEKRKNYQPLPQPPSKSALKIESNHSVREQKTSSRQSVGGPSNQDNQNSLKAALKKESRSLQIKDEDDSRNQPSGIGNQPSGILKESSNQPETNKYVKHSKQNLDSKENLPDAEISASIPRLPATLNDLIDPMRDAPESDGQYKLKKAEALKLDHKRLSSSETDLPEIPTTPTSGTSQRRSHRKDKKKCCIVT